MSSPFKAMTVTLVIVTTLFQGCAIFRPSSHTIQEELQQEYDAIVQGFLRNDPSVWIARLTPTFQLTLLNGSMQNYDWVVRYVMDNTKVFHIDTLNMRIRAVAIEGDHVIVTVEQTSSRTFKDESGQPHRLEVGAIQLETWEKVEGAWKLEGVKEKEILYLRQDGK